MAAGWGRPLDWEPVKLQDDENLPGRGRGGVTVKLLSTDGAWWSVTRTEGWTAPCAMAEPGDDQGCC